MIENEDMGAIFMLRNLSLYFWEKISNVLITIVWMKDNEVEWLKQENPNMQIEASNDLSACISGNWPDLVLLDINLWVEKDWIIQMQDALTTNGSPTNILWSRIACTWSNVTTDRPINETYKSQLVDILWANPENFVAKSASLDAFKIVADKIFGKNTTAANPKSSVAA